MFPKLLSKTILLPLVFSSFSFSQESLTYKIIDTGQMDFFDDKSYISTPNKGDEYFGQDSSYLGHQAIYKDNKNGTISDIQTGLMWQKDFSSKMSWSQAVDYANSSTLGGYVDWRIPTVKELYSLINFNGKTGTARYKDTKVPSDAKPYLNTEYFDFEYSKERRYIDAQYWSSTDYTSTTMKGNETFFGVNFADGRIKGYPKNSINGHGGEYYLRLVRGNKHYGQNKFEDKNDGTIMDHATGLLWTKSDYGTFNWKEALEHCESLKIGDNDKFRLPNVKELHSLIDYTKSPDSSKSASINHMFDSMNIINENNVFDFGYYWSSTTHLDGRNLGTTAAYISFGRALGYMEDRRFGAKVLLDVHGSGAQRSDPKSGDSSTYKYGRGPQGDVIRINNHVRCVSDNYTKLNTNRKVVKDLLGKTNFSKNKNRHKAMQRFDKDYDGKISFSEAPKKMKMNFKRHDLNSDGFIDEKEVHTLPKPK